MTTDPNAVRPSRSLSDHPTGAAPPLYRQRLGVFIGLWITEGETAASTEAPVMRIVASDVYKWAPGEQFVLHPAYGHIGGVDVGGIEIIAYDPATQQYRTHFFDSQGNATTGALSY